MCVNSSCDEGSACRIFQRVRKKRELFQGWNSWLRWSSGYSWSTSPSLRPHSFLLSLTFRSPSLPPSLPCLSFSLWFYLVVFFFFTLLNTNLSFDDLHGVFFPKIKSKPHRNTWGPFSVKNALHVFLMLLFGLDWVILDESLLITWGCCTCKCWCDA